MLHANRYKIESLHPNFVICKRTVINIRKTVQGTLIVTYRKNDSMMELVFNKIGYYEFNGKKIARLVPK